MAISLDLTRYKSAGVFFEEADNTQRYNSSAETLRLAVGFSNKGVFNRPVYLENETQRFNTYGEINTKLEHKGCYFNRMTQTLLREGAVLALNLLKVDDSYNGPDQVNFAALSLDAGMPNPIVGNADGKYGQYDYLSESIDTDVYETSKGDVVPYIGKTPYASLFDRSRFWIPSEHNLLASVASILKTGDVNTFEHTNFLNVANCGTEEFSLLIYKAENVKGYDVTAAEWYDGAENIPFGWVRPSDYVSDYFITVIAVKGNWSNYPALSVDPIWGPYFDNKGIKKSMIDRFLGAEGVTVLGTWTGSIIPDFTNKQGVNQNIFTRINASTEKTGILISFNEDAAEVLAYDYNGTNPEGEEVGEGCWFTDIDGDRNLTLGQGESACGVGAHLIDMVGHNLQIPFAKRASDDSFKSYDDDANKEIKRSRLAAIKDAKIVYLQTATELTSTPSIVESTFKNAGKKYIYVFDYKDGELKFAVKDASGKYLPVEVTYDIVRTNQVDTPADPTNSQVNFNAANKELTNEFIRVENVFGLDAVTLRVTVYADDENSFVKTLSYVAPVDTYKSSEYNAKYGFYFAVIADSKGTPKSADIYQLTYKATTAAGRTSYQDQFTKYVSNVSVETEFDEDTQAIYTIAFNGIKYTIHTNNAGTAYRVETTVADQDPDNFYGVNFLSYNYVTKDIDDIITKITDVKYLEDVIKTPGNGDFEDNKYTLVIADDEVAKKVKVGDFVNNIVAGDGNKNGKAQQYKVIPGVTRVIKKIFINLNVDNTFSYNGKIYTYNSDHVISNPAFATRGFYLIVTIDPVGMTKETVRREFVTIKQTSKEGEVVQRKKLYPVIFEADSNKVEQIRQDGVPVKGITYIKKADSEAETDVVKYDVLEDSGDDARVVAITSIKFEDEYGIDYTESGNYLEKAVKGEEGWSLEFNGAIDMNGDKVAMAYEYDPLISTWKVYFMCNEDVIILQKPISDASISSSLRFIPLKGLKISSRHKPGYDENGNVDIEGGIKKIYSVLEDEGVQKGLLNPEMANFRYVVDTMGYGLDEELGGKVYLSRLAMNKGKCTAILNLPSQRQFALSENPYFCDTYVAGQMVKPAFKVKYIAKGGNDELYSSKLFTLPSEENGAKFTSCFWPYVQYTSGAKKILVPPAADVCNALSRKFKGNDPFMIVANTQGILGGSVTGVEYSADQSDRDYLEPLGVNTIISRRGQVMIYGNQTAYQKVKSDFNKLHIRENLNTIEIACQEVLDNYVFQYNNAVTRAAVVTQLTPILQAAQASGAIMQYKIVCDESNNTNEIIDESIMLVDINVIMGMGSEKIVCRLTLNRRSDTL